MFVSPVRDSWLLFTLRDNQSCPTPLTRVSRLHGQLPLHRTVQHTSVHSSLVPYSPPPPGFPPNSPVSLIAQNPFSLSHSLAKHVNISSAGRPEPIFLLCNPRTFHPPPSPHPNPPPAYGRFFSFPGGWMSGTRFPLNSDCSSSLPIYLSSTISRWGFPPPPPFLLHDIGLKGI